jgi:uncharacterized protein (DUF433 family)
MLGSLEARVRKLPNEPGALYGATEADLLDAYPRLTPADIQAALAYAADSLADETIVLQPV